MTLPIVIMFCGLVALLPAAFVAGVLSLLDRDLAIFSGVFTFGYAFSSFLGWMDEIPMEEEE